MELATTPEPDQEVDHTTTASTKKKCSRGGNGGQTRRKVSAIAKHRQRQVPIEECHLKSLKGLQVPFPGGDNPITFHHYLGEHQSQVFYGGFEVLAPKVGCVHVEIGQATPMDLRKNFADGPAVPSLAVPLHIFRRFHEPTTTPATPTDVPKQDADPSGSGEAITRCGIILNGNKSPHCAPNGTSTTTKNNGNSSTDQTVDLSAVTNELYLISICAYYPVQYMESANNRFDGSLKGSRVHYPPKPEEMVAFENVITFTISEFIHRMLRGIEECGKLLKCSAPLPQVPKSIEHAATTDSQCLRPSGFLNNFPTYLVLPAPVFNRLRKMDLMLRHQFNRPNQPKYGLASILPDSELAESEALRGPLKGVDWTVWSGLKMTYPMYAQVFSRILNGLETANIRMVFVRRETNDCGDAIDTDLHKSDHRPARIRRNRMRGSSEMVLKLKRLKPETGCGVTTKEPLEENHCNGQEVPTATNDVTGTKQLKYDQVLARDYRTNPRMWFRRMCPVNPKAASLLSAMMPESPKQYPPAFAPANTNGKVGLEDEVNGELNGGDDDTLSIAARRHRRQLQQFHQQYGHHQELTKQPQELQNHHHRPSRACVPPKRLEAADRDLERALQRSLAEGRAKSTHGAASRSNTTVATAAKKRARPKRSATAIATAEAKSTAKETLNQQNRTPMEQLNGVVDSLLNGTGLRATSPSAASDSCIATRRGKRRANSKSATAMSNAASPLGEPSTGAEIHRIPPKKARKTNGHSSKAPSLKVVLSVDKKIKYAVKEEMEACAEEPPKFEDPYMLPSTPPPVEKRRKIPARRLKRSPSPDPPVLLPEVEVKEDGENGDSSKSPKSHLNGSVSADLKHEQNATISPVPSLPKLQPVPVALKAEPSTPLPPLPVPNQSSDPHAKSNHKPPASIPHAFSASVMASSDVPAASKAPNVVVHSSQYQQHQQQQQPHLRSQQQLHQPQIRPQQQHIPSQQPPLPRTFLEFFPVSPGSNPSMPNTVPALFGDNARVPALSNPPVAPTPVANPNLVQPSWTNDGAASVTTSAVLNHVPATMWTHRKEPLPAPDQPLKEVENPATQRQHHQQQQPTNSANQPTVPLRPSVTPIVFPQLPPQPLLSFVSPSALANTPAVAPNNATEAEFYQRVFLNTIAAAAAASTAENSGNGEATANNNASMHAALTAYYEIIRRQNNLAAFGVPNLNGVNGGVAMSAPALRTPLTNSTVTSAGHLSQQQPQLWHNVGRRNGFL